jgi:hypothetical protein
MSTLPSFHLRSGFLTKREEWAIVGLDSVNWAVLCVSISNLPDFVQRQNSLMSGNKSSCWNLSLVKEFEVRMNFGQTNVQNRLRNFNPACHKIPSKFFSCDELEYCAHEKLYIGKFIAANYIKAWNISVLKETILVI